MKRNPCRMKHIETDGLPGKALVSLQNLDSADVTAKHLGPEPIKRNKDTIPEAELSVGLVALKYGDGNIATMSKGYIIFATNAHNRNQGSQSLLMHHHPNQHGFLIISVHPFIH